MMDTPVVVEHPPLCWCKECDNKRLIKKYDPQNWEEGECPDSHSGMHLWINYGGRRYIDVRCFACGIKK